ncbi:Uncharacterised protein [Streptococcus pneumoniae]|nr:Uncharacterised protein [Streptococcus pneumoniae]CKF66670.1 Uncharacterised protein [Streptococcus pneumoniae]COL37631.1 Uncharacterised protein [Streptococcus pneumoniae]
MHNLFSRFEYCDILFFLYIFTPWKAIYFTSYITYKIWSIPFSIVNILFHQIPPVFSYITLIYFYHKFLLFDFVILLLYSQIRTNDEFWVYTSFPWR